VKRRVSLRARNLNGENIKVNDKAGNPIQIAAVVVWQVEDTYRASFDVEHFESYVVIQSEAAVRHLAGIYPYDTFEDGAEEKMTLRAGAERVSDELERELGERFARAGIKVIEARLSHLAYAPEIAEAMLRRQQATAVALPDRPRRGQHGRDGAQSARREERRGARRRAEGRDGEQPARRPLQRALGFPRRQRGHALPVSR
jgi:regulator of protease activity HflC (stomatin/prohibitin superfamily)